MFIIQLQNFKCLLPVVFLSPSDRKLKKISQANILFYIPQIYLSNFQMFSISNTKKRFTSLRQPARLALLIEVIYKVRGSKVLRSCNCHTIFTNRLKCLQVYKETHTHTHMYGAVVSKILLLWRKKDRQGNANIRTFHTEMNPTNLFNEFFHPLHVSELECMRIRVNVFIRDNIKCKPIPIQAWRDT